MKVTIKNTEVSLKYSFRAMLAYEEATKNLDKQTDLEQLMLMMFIIVSTSNTELGLTFDEFINWLEEDEKRFYAIRDWMSHVNRQRVDIRGKLSGADVRDSAESDGKKKE